MEDTGSYSITFADYDDEKSTFRIRIPILDAANIDAVTGQLFALLAAVNACTFTNIIKTETTAYINYLSGASATEKESQREKKWTLSLLDTVNHDRFSVDIPCANLDYLSDVDGLKGHMAAGGIRDNLVAAVEAVMLSKQGNPVTVRKIVYEGRDL